MINNISGQIVFTLTNDKYTFIIGEEVKTQTKQGEVLRGILISVFENSLKLKRRSGTSENIDFDDIIDISRHSWQVVTVKL